MFRNSSTGSTRRIRSVHVVAAGALVLAMSGSATAAMVITGKQIKDNSVTGKDIKNGSLLIKDFKASEATKLRGPAGANGANGATGATGGTGATGATGAAGASAFAPPPSGTTIKGGGILNIEVDGVGVSIRDYAPIPFTTSTPLIDGTGRNIYFGPAQNSGSMAFGQSDGTLCPGTSTAPNPTAGYMCVYVSQATNVEATSAELYAGSSGGPDAAENSGIYLLANSAAPGTMLVRYVWAYKAP